MSQVRAIQPSTRSVTAATKNVMQAAIRRRRVRHAGRDRQQHEHRHQHEPQRGQRVGRRWHRRWPTGADSARRPGHRPPRRLPRDDRRRLLGRRDTGSLARTATRPDAARYACETNPYPPVAAEIILTGSATRSTPDAPRPAPRRGRPAAARRDRRRHRTSVRRAVDLGRLVRARPSTPSSDTESTSTSTVRADPVLGALAAQLLGQRAEPVVPPRDRAGPDLAGQPGGLGAVLVAVVEDADRVQPGLGQEALQLVVFGRGLAREADDEVAAGAGAAARAARAEASSSQNRSVEPNRRIRRSTDSDECWNDRSK